MKNVINTAATAQICPFSHAAIAANGEYVAPEKKESMIFIDASAEPRFATVAEAVAAAKAYRESAGLMPLRVIGKSNVLLQGSWISYGEMIKDGHLGIFTTVWRKGAQSNTATSDSVIENVTPDMVYEAIHKTDYIRYFVDPSVELGENEIYIWSKFEQKKLDIRQGELIIYNTVTKQARKI